MIHALFLFNQRQNVVTLKKFIDEQSAFLCPLSLNFGVDVAVVCRIAVCFSACISLPGILLIQVPDLDLSLILPDIFRSIQDFFRNRFRPRRHPRQGKISTESLHIRHLEISKTIFRERKGSVKRKRFSQGPVHIGSIEERGRTPLCIIV